MSKGKPRSKDLLRVHLKGIYSKGIGKSGFREYSLSMNARGQFPTWTHSFQLSGHLRKSQLYWS